MDSKLKEKLYNDLNHILSLLEDRSINMAKKEVEVLIQSIYYDQYK
jgi:hypothetical protein